MGVEIRNLRPEDHEALLEMATTIAAEVGSTNSGFSGMDDWRWKYLDPLTRQRADASSRNHDPDQIQRVRRRHA